ncbi:hypothetical protein [Marinobacterium sedimentorum]|uniref:hypothetical protein n=1 Tax=Marinobacterium sedimentorum TaxID=2927804 RepID=UPI0020C5E8D5|nr:hypothetical protein [Marinobacterium sedimentorum]MCP8686426.1 hypothetical protein [Marinobacterium sedimentorum]
MANELILMLHPSFGVLAILASLWVFVEALNTESRVSAGRIRVASLACAVLMWLSYLVGGYWYVLFYGADKALINAGPWPFAHSFFMETKEHVFFTLLLLASYLPVAAFNLTSNRAVRTLVLSVAGLIIVLGLAMEGAGAFISMGSKMALLGKVAAGM